MSTVPAAASAAAASASSMSSSSSAAAAGPAAGHAALEEAVRVKVRAALTKQMKAELANTLEAKLAASFGADAASYTSAYRSLVSILKPRTDKLNPDSQLTAPSLKPAKDSSGVHASTDFDNALADLLSQKLSVGRLINRVGEHEKAKRGLLKETVKPGAAQAALGEQQLAEEALKAQKARGLGELVSRIKILRFRVGLSADTPDALAKGAAAAPAGAAKDDAAVWEELATALMQLYRHHSPTLSYAEQSLAAYDRVESLSTEFVQRTMPGFWIKRAAVHTLLENFAAAVEDLKRFAAIQADVPGVAPPAAAAAASAAAAAASSSSSAAAAAAPARVPYSALVAPRLSTLGAFVSTVSKQVASRCSLDAAAFSTQLHNLPNPSDRDMQRAMGPVNKLQPGLNAGKGFVARILAKVDQTSLARLCSDRASGTDSPALPLGSHIFDSLSGSQFHAPFDYIAADGQGLVFVLAVYNVRVDLGAKAHKKRIKAGDSVIVFDPFVREVDASVGDKAGKYLSVQVHNPFLIFVNTKQAFESDDAVRTIDFD